jgi:hypothetical protein
LISFFKKKENLKEDDFNDPEDFQMKPQMTKLKMSERLQRLKNEKQKKTEDLFQLIQDFRDNWQRTRRSRTSLTKEDSVSDSQSYFDPIYRKKNKKIRIFMKNKKDQIEQLFPEFFEFRNSEKHYFIWHPHWPTFRRLYGTKLRGFYVDNSMFVNELLSFLPELSRFLFRLGVIRQLFVDNQTDKENIFPKNSPLNKKMKSSSNRKKKNNKGTVTVQKDPLTDEFIENNFLNNFTKLELRKVMTKQLKLKPRFAKLVSDFVFQSVFLHFGAAGLDKNVSQDLMKKFLAGRFDSKSLLQTIRDYKYKGKYFIPVMAEDL